MSAAPETIQWYKEVGVYAPTRTRHDDVRVWHQDTGIWRTLVCDSEGNWSQTGPPYATRGEALSVVDRVHASWNGLPWDEDADVRARLAAAYDQGRHDQWRDPTATTWANPYREDQ